MLSRNANHSCHVLPGTSRKTTGVSLTLARLHEGERLKSLVVRAKPPGNMTKAWASLTKRSLREEIFQVDQFRVVDNDLIGLLFKGNKIFKPKLRSRPAPS